MNTPKKPKEPKRYQFRGQAVLEGETWFEPGIKNGEIASRLAQVVARFVHLEERMADVLAVLLDSDHREPARHIIATIKSPKGRIDIMKALLAEAEHNVQRETFFDEVIAEFVAINGARNIYVHGAWWHADTSGKTYLSGFMEGFPPSNPNPVESKEMDNLIHRIDDLDERISFSEEIAAYHHEKRRQRERSPQHEVPKSD